MNPLFTSNITRKSTLLVFLIHLLVAHVIFENYVLCLESNGRIVLENLPDIEHCCSLNIYEILQYNGERPLQECSYCEDIGLTEICDEENSVSTSKILHLSLEAYFLTSDKMKMEPKPLNSNIFITNPLKVYKTVSLLI